MDIILSRIISLIPSKRGSKKELADAVGIPANLISEWEKGRNKSYPKYLPQIADYYGVSLDWLSGRSEQKENPPAGYGEGKSEDTILFSAYKAAPQNVQEAIRNLLGLK